MKKQIGFHVAFTVITLGFTVALNAQNTGIGTINPQSKLHVYGGASGQNFTNGLLTLENNENNYVEFLSPGTKAAGLVFGDQTNAFKASILYNTDLNVGGYTFKPDAGIGYGMIIDKFGKVGIHNQSPQSLLQISSGSTGITPHALANLTLESVNNNYLQFLSAAGKESGLLFGNPTGISQGGIVYNNVGNPEGLDFRTNGNIVRMIIDNTGKLDVYGGVRIRGNTPVAGAMLRSSDNQGNTTWMKPAAFKANGLYGNANLECDAGVWTKILFGTPLYNEGFAYQPLAGNFVAPVNGIYHFDVQVIKGLSNSHYMRIQSKRGNSYTTLGISNSASGDVSNITISTEAKLQAGDEVFVSFISIGGVIVTLQQSLTEVWFDGHLVTQL